MSCCKPNKVVNLEQSPEDFFRSGTGATVPDGTNDLTESVSRPGDTGFGIADPTEVAAKLDVEGAEILRPVVLPNFAANAAIGTAAATVDIASGVLITQTTPNIVLTLPAPSNTQAGRLLFVGNTGTQPVTVSGQVIANGTGIPFSWTGTAWIPYGAAGGVVEDFWRSNTGATLPDGTNDFTENITHNGNMGLGIADPATLAARHDVNGAEVLRTVALANFAANAAIGTAAATVNIASTISIPQTTVGITLTIPAPTNAQAGRVLSIANTGTAQLKVANQYITPGTAQGYVWSGAAWVPLGDNPDFITVAASRAAAPTDHLKTLLATAPITITVGNAVGNYCLFRVRQQTAAAIVTIAVGGVKVLVAPFGASTIGIAGTSMVVEVINNQVFVE